MLILKATFRGRDDFRRAFSSEPLPGVLFVATTTPQEVGERVVVEIVCGSLPNNVLVKGKVASWRPALPRKRVRAGAFVQFDKAESDKAKFILSTLSGEITPPRRRYSRIPVDIPVTWRTPGATDVTRSRLVEISIGGALLESTDKHELGTDILVEAQLPGAVTPVEIASKVAYHAPRGMGLKFIYRDGGGSRRIRELVRRLRAE